MASTPPATDECLRATICQLGDDIRDFWQPLHAVERVDVSTLTPLEFHRQFVSKNVPVILTNAMTSQEWMRVRTKWQDDTYLIDKAGNAPVTVDITPFGYGDAVLSLQESDLFVMPEEREMTLQQFLSILSDRKEFDGVPYLSHQNDSLREEFPSLAAEVPSCVALAKEAFGNNPDAINIWIGDERAVSSMHKDHYENMYCVVKGQKHFTLLPPAAVVCLYEREYPSARYRHDSSSSTSAENPADPVATAQFHQKYPQYKKWEIVPSPETGATPWIPVDPLCIDNDQFPLAQHLQPLECVVNFGEILYLPSMWYHRATQTCTTISINYWHDMEFDCRYVYYNFVHGLAAAVSKKFSPNGEFKVNDNK